MNDRVRNLRGIHNFRDYGGYRCSAGTIRRGLLWRSGQHGAATQADLEAVAALGIRTVIDLRGDTERSAAPCLRPAGFAGAVLFAPGETSSRSEAPHVAAARDIADPAMARAAMRALYEGMAFRPVLVGTLRLYLAALATREDASLIHCFAGKDRTGVAVAVLHLLLGVHPDDAMADYLLTMTAGDQAERLARSAPAIRARYGAHLDEATIAALMGVEAAYLDTALATIRDRHGSVERYAEEMLGVDAAQRAAIAARLVA